MMNYSASNAQAELLSGINEIAQSQYLNDQRLSSLKVQNDRTNLESELISLEKVLIEERCKKRKELADLDRLIHQVHQDYYWAQLAILQNQAQDFKKDQKRVKSQNKTHSKEMEKAIKIGRCQIELLKIEIREQENAEQAALAGQEEVHFTVLEPIADITALVAATFPSLVSISTLYKKRGNLHDKNKLKVEQLLTDHSRPVEQRQIRVTDHTNTKTCSVGCLCLSICEKRPASDLSAEPLFVAENSARNCGRQRRMLVSPQYWLCPLHPGSVFKVLIDETDLDVPYKIIAVEIIQKD